MEGGGERESRKHGVDKGYKILVDKNCLWFLWKGEVRTLAGDRDPSGRLVKCHFCGAVRAELRGVHPGFFKWLVPSSKLLRRPVLEAGVLVVINVIQFEIAEFVAQVNSTEFADPVISVAVDPGFVAWKRILQGYHKLLDIVAVLRNGQAKQIGVNVGGLKHICRELLFQQARDRYRVHCAVRGQHYVRGEPLLLRCNNGRLSVGQNLLFRVEQDVHITGPQLLVASILRDGCEAGDPIHFAASLAAHAEQREIREQRQPKTLGFIVHQFVTKPKIIIEKKKKCFEMILISIIRFPLSAMLKKNGLAGIDQAQSNNAWSAGSSPALHAASYRSDACP